MWSAGNFHILVYHEFGTMDAVIMFKITKVNDDSDVSETKVTSNRKLESSRISIGSPKKNLLPMNTNASPLLLDTMMHDAELGHP